MGGVGGGPLHLDGQRAQALREHKVWEHKVQTSVRTVVEPGGSKSLQGKEGCGGSYCSSWLGRAAWQQDATPVASCARCLRSGGSACAGAVRAHRDLQSSSDACHYVSVSGSTYQTSLHGLYEATGTCESQLQALVRASTAARARKCGILHGKWWILGYDGCDSGYGGIFSPSDTDGDLAAVSGTWEEVTGGWVANSEISVKCYAAASCQLVPGTTAKYRCFDCADASASASVGDGQCDAANNVSPCWDGGDCLRNDVHRRRFPTQAATSTRTRAAPTTAKTP